MSWIPTSQTLPPPEKPVEVWRNHEIVLATWDGMIWKTEQGLQIDVRYWRRGKQQRDLRTVRH